MSETYPVSLGIRAVERAIRECDAATPGPWRQVILDLPVDIRQGVEWQSNDRFAILARAGFRASLEYLRLDLSYQKPDGYVLDQTAAAVAPLIQHYDATAPGWRTE